MHLLLLTVALAIVSPASAPARSCDVCKPPPVSRTGPYTIVVSKQFANASGPLRVRVTIINRSHRQIVLGPSRSPHALLRLTAPRYRFAEAIEPRGGAARIPAGSRLSFDANVPYRLGRPGLYRLSVSYGPVISNTLTYTVM